MSEQQLHGKPVAFLVAAEGIPAFDVKLVELVATA